MTTPAARSRPERPWSVPVAAAEVPESGRHFDLVADDSIRAAVAKLADLRALTSLAATFDVTRFGRGGLHVVGRVSGLVGQVCVVTLEPMDSRLEETVDLIFSSTQADLTGNDGKEVDVTTEDAPEPLIDGVVDLGAIATEFLILGIDPYPRKPDAVFEPLAAEGDPVRPFAALAALKKDEGQQ